VEKSLPIWQLKTAILGSLRAGNRLVLAAPTGSGKSTQVPQMLVDGMGFQKVVVLQPRRVAARTLAARVAWERNSRLGGEVGYQIRFEDQTSRGTKISFVTEGILLRWLQDDPELTGLDAVIFDEFHERNLQSDVALGLVKAIQEKKRPELKVVVMSATLDTVSVANYLGEAPVLISEGTMFPVEINYLEYGNKSAVAEQAAEAVEEIINAGESGDILVFMPGMGEIQAAIAACRSLRINEKVALIPLHGELPGDDQDRAFAPNTFRKIVVSTNVAETSVTIDGVRHVIDSGLARVARYDPERGIGTLMIEEISRASADQRKGRAGRTAPGTCQRLWTESNHLNRSERNTPEIQRADLAEVVLLLHSLGIRKAAEFDWLDKPDTQAVERAEKLLRMLGAIFEQPGEPHSDLTPIGRKMLRLPMHPRYSRMLVEAAQNGCTNEAVLCAALVSGRDLLVRLGREEKHISQARENFEKSDQSDFFVLMDAYKYAQEHRFNVEACRRYGIHAGSAQQVGMTWGQLLDIAKSHLPKSEEAACTAEKLQKCILTGFIDQLCIRRDQGSLECFLTQGRSGTLARESVVQKASMFVAASIREISGKNGPLTLLGLATAVKLEWLKEMYPQHFRVSLEHRYDRTHKRVEAIQITRFEDLIVAQEHSKNFDPSASGLALADAHLEGLFELPLLTHELKQFMARVNLVAKAVPGLEFPHFDKASLKNVLGKAFEGLFLAKEAQGKELKGAMRGHLAPEQLSWLDELAPEAVAWRERKKLKLQYPDNPPEDREVNPPEAQVKLHECFGLESHPKICEGEVAVKLWLCSPDGKRIQSTSNWPEFRAKEYPKIKANLQKKFPGFTWL
jgi:ATP-dependent helicase HrpB